MTEAKKMIFFANDLEIQAFGFAASMFQKMFNSTLKRFPDQALTIQVWVKVQHITTADEVVSVIASGGPSNNYGFTLIIDKDEQLVGVQQNISMIYTGATIPIGIWTHIAFTRDSSGTIVKAYINGNKVHEQVVRAQGQLPDCVHFVSTSTTAHTRDVAKLSVHSIEFTADEIAFEAKNPRSISHKDDLLALFIDGVRDGLLIDHCGSYNITCNDMIENRGPFKL